MKQIFVLSVLLLALFSCESFDIDTDYEEEIIIKDSTKYHPNDKKALEALWEANPEQIPYLFNKRLNENGRVSHMFFNEFSNISTLPPEIQLLEELEEIDFEFNEISSIPEEFCNLAKLKWFSFNKNILSTLPISITKLSPEACSFTSNYLEREVVGDSIAQWLDTFDPGWDTVQRKK